MGILSDRDIEEAIREGRIEIENFTEKNLTPNGYDLTIAEIYVNGKIYREGKIKIPPNTWFAISTKETIRLGSDICAQLWIRSSYARKGILACFGKVDAGFKGTLTIGCFNGSNKEVEISVGDTFCQIVFEEMKTGASKTYEQRSGKYQNQKGLTL
ncbi:MAG: dCTP deaminase [Thermoplasmata archaeon]|nr:dCTP deaminase [Thermoplasmata archaeon]